MMCSALIGIINYKTTESLLNLFGCNHRCAHTREEDRKIQGVGTLMLDLNDKFLKN